MTKSLILSLAITLLAAAAPAAAQVVKKPAEPPLVINDAPTPSDVVRELYKVHRNGNGHVFEKQGRKLQQKFFERNLAALIWKDVSETPEGELGNIDFDPLYNAQDTQIKNFRVGASTIKENTATVPVTFMNFDQRVRLTFRLVNTKGGWRVSNIVYGGGMDFVQILSQPM